MLFHADLDDRDFGRLVLSPVEILSYGIFSFRNFDLFASDYID